MKSDAVFLLEDDESICELIECALSINNIKIKTFNTISSFYEELKENEPRIAILDIMLTDGNGLDVLKYIKSNNPNIYCIMLSALGKETDKVKGLNLGADDYISKPFGILEFTAKIKAVLRRMNIDEKNINVNNIQINEDTMTVIINGKKADINNKEFQILVYLIKNKNRVISRENLMINIFGYDHGEARTLDNYIAHLRKEGATGIETVYGVGYCYKED